MRAKLERARDELRALADLFFGTPSVVARLDGTGPVSKAAAEDVGLVGPAARAAGCERDVRQDHPTGAYRSVHIPIALGETGDVYARALVRRFETERALAFLLGATLRLPPGPAHGPCGPLEPGSVVVALVEGFRGETVHAIITDAAGGIARYKVVDPSFHNWFGLALAMRGQAISDFPLCNKSFDLSYAGHDL